MNIACGQRSNPVPDQMHSKLGDRVRSDIQSSGRLRHSLVYPQSRGLRFTNKGMNKTIPNYICGSQKLLKSQGKYQLPKGIIWSAVPLPYFFAVLKSQRVSGRRPQGGTKTCSIRRNFVCMTVRPYIHPSV